MLKSIDGNWLCSYIWFALRVDLQNFVRGLGEFDVVDCDCSPLYSLEDLALEVPVRGTFNVQLDGGQNYLLQGMLSGRQKLVCVRTLEEFWSPFSIQFKILVKKTAGIKEQEIDDSDETLFCLNINPSLKILDLSECLRQLILLEQPINPIKEPEKSFEWVSPESGEDRIDPRWAKLEALKKSMNQKD